MPIRAAVAVQGARVDLCQRLAARRGPEPAGRAGLEGEVVPGALRGRDAPDALSARDELQRVRDAGLAAQLAVLDVRNVRLPEDDLVLVRRVCRVPLLLFSAGR